MTDIQTFTTFLGWCTVINIAVLCFSTVALLVLKDTFAKIHGKMFGLGEADLSTAYIRYLGNYKIAIIMLNLVPYLALKLMS